MLPKFLALLTLLLVGVGCAAEPPVVATPDPLPQVPTEADEPVVVEAETAVPDTDEFAAQREQLIREGIIGWGITDEAVNTWLKPTTTIPCPSATARRFHSLSLWP
jgi:hypothetical protein